MELKRVVVTGLGALTPVGNNVAETWENLVNGVSGAGPITHFDASKFKTQFACEVKGFNPNEHFDRKEARKMDLYTQYAIVAAKEAIEDAAMDLDKEDKTKIGVIYGVGIGGIRTFEEEMIAYAGVKDTIGPKFNPFFIPSAPPPPHWQTKSVMPLGPAILCPARCVFTGTDGILPLSAAPRVG